MPLEYLVESLAKALCFEKYVAINNIVDYDNIDSDLAVAFFEEHSDLYMHKSRELLSMFHDFEDSENKTNTLH
ncbi:uncharacterized protein METZ01_LOCUS332859 [marine metagenome]|uniref:Uncharacterized protein n=1 Tax=marine metagenome TaxID=408172 RepID=A0A382Q500_9ZZZZ